MDHKLLHRITTALGERNKQGGGEDWAILLILVGYFGGLWMLPLGQPHRRTPSGGYEKSIATGDAVGEIIYKLTVSLTELIPHNPFLDVRMSCVFALNARNCPTIVTLSFRYIEQLKQPTTETKPSHSFYSPPALRDWFSPRMKDGRGPGRTRCCKSLPVSLMSMCGDCSVGIFPRQNGGSGWGTTDK
uniref:Uncharacterized protein n=1 Tax=Anopheles culicifacies TaxID=139723 RepID=A0A182LXC8_9DIPT